VMKPLTGCGVALSPALLCLPSESLDGCMVLSHREEIFRRLPRGFLRRKDFVNRSAKQTSSFRH
jgi:hypothetical protein